MSIPLQTTTRPTFWRIGPVGEAVFYYLAALAILLFVYGVYERFARYARGSEDPMRRLDNLPKRVMRAASLALSNRKQLDRDIVAGAMHALVVWGFLTLLVGTTILGIDMDLYRPLTGSSFFVGEFYRSYSFVMDAMGLLFVVGVGVALWRRYGRRLDRLWGRHTSNEDGLFLGALFVLGVGGYATEAVRILGTSTVRDVSFETVSFVGWALKDLLVAVGVTPEMAATAYPYVWWSHSLVALWFVAWIPRAKPFHMFASFANLVARDEKAGVRLPGVPADAAPEDIGPSDIDDFSWKQLLDQDACTKCGRCSSVCPAKDAGRPLDPRDVIRVLKRYREQRDAGGEAVPIVTDGGTSVIDAHTMESCMSCMACMDACPVDIEHVTQFTEMNRRLTEAGEMDDNVAAAMTDAFQHGNTFGEPERARPDWTEDLDFEVPDARAEPVEYLWYVGDYPSYDERNQRVARALATIFETAGVSYGILYEAERSDGNDVRRVGEEGLYELLVEDNAAAIADCEFDHIVTTDPHAYNTFMNEYPEFDACEWGPEDVSHYTQVVADLAASGALGLTGDELDRTVTYHDPCHLGRYNDVFEAPRELVRATGATLAEMPRNRDDSFCCGGGGGGLWMDFDDDPKPSEERLREALAETDGPVEQFVVACPMCMTMYEDGRKTGGYEDDIEIVDVAELLVEAVEEQSNDVRPPMQQPADT
jgi:Fe-S oxidoreductase